MEHIGNVSAHCPAPGYDKTLVLDNVAAFCFSVWAASDEDLRETKHKTKRVLKQNTRFNLPRITIRATIGGRPILALFSSGSA